MKTRNKQKILKIPAFSKISGLASSQQMSHSPLTTLKTSESSQTLAEKTYDQSTVIMNLIYDDYDMKMI